MRFSASQQATEVVRETTGTIRLKETTMTTMLSERIETGDVIEINRDGEMMSVLVLLATEDAVILDACDDSTPFVMRRCDLIDYRLFDPAA